MVCTPLLRPLSVVLLPLGLLLFGLDSSRGQVQRPPASTETTFSTSGKITIWLADPEFVAMVKEQTSGGYYPVAIEGREVDGALQYRAKFAPPSGDKYFGCAWFRGLTSAGYESATTSAKAQGYQEEYLSSFDDATGIPSESSEPFIRARAVEAIGLLGTRAASAVPTLIKACGDQSFSVQEAAVNALRTIGPAASAAVPTLIQLVQEKHWRLIPPAAIRALGAIGPAAKDALPVLNDCLRSSNTELRDNAMWAAQLILGEDYGPSTNFHTPR